MFKTTAIVAALAAGLALSSYTAFRAGVQHGFVRALAEFDAYAAVTSEKTYAHTLQSVLSSLRRGDAGQAEAILTGQLVSSATALSNAMELSRRYDYLQGECSDILRIADSIRDENLLRTLKPEAKRSYDREMIKIRNLCNRGVETQKT
jgi:hypothetical protein